LLIIVHFLDKKKKSKIKKSKHSKKSKTAVGTKEKMKTKKRHPIHSIFESSDGDINIRIIGEIAYQLNRRMVRYVFSREMTDDVTDTATLHCDDCNINEMIKRQDIYYIIYSFMHVFFNL